MGAGAEIAAGIAGGVLDSVPNWINAIYNIESSKRDFDYQKSVQQEVWNREDNAVQRRMADLKAAGLNPNLAAGSAAGAGAVVGRSNTPQLNLHSSVGAALDAASAVQQLRAQREQNEILKNQKIQSDYATSLANYEYGTSKLQSMFDRAALYNQLGIKSLQLRFNENGNVSLWSPEFKKSKYNIDLDDSPLFQQLRWQVQNNKNSADLLQKDVDFYTADKIADYFGIGARIFSGVGSGLYSFGKYNKYYR